MKKNLLSLLLLLFALTVPGAVRFEVDSPSFQKEKGLRPTNMLIFNAKTDSGEIGSAQVRFFDTKTKKRIFLNDSRVRLTLRPQKGDKRFWSESIEIDRFSIDRFDAGQVRCDLAYEADGKTGIASFLIPVPYRDLNPVKESAEFQAAFPANYDWIKEIRPEHPRLFLNREMIPGIRKWAKQYGFERLVKQVEALRYDPNRVRKQRGNVGDRYPYSERDVTVPGDYSDESMLCATAYILTGEKKYARKAWEFLNHSLKSYDACLKTRSSINWYGMTRIQELAAYDWIYDTLTPEERKAYITEFHRIMKEYIHHGWFGPLCGINSGLGTMTGFYGEKNIAWFLGLAAYGDGFCDKEALDMLKFGYDRYRAMLVHREMMAEDNGFMGTAALDYSFGQYPNSSIDFMFAWKSAIRGKELPILRHLLYLGEWYYWNMIPIRPDKYGISFRRFHLGDCGKTGKERMPGALPHILAIMSIYKDRCPEDVGHMAWIYTFENRKKAFDPGTIREPAVKAGTKFLPSAPKYSWRGFIPYLMFSPLNDGVKTIPPTERYARNFTKGGVIIMNSGKNVDDTYALFHCGSSGGHKSRGDENHFEIFKNGFVAMDSGTRLQDGTPHNLKYHASSLAHNTILIDMPGETFPGDVKAALHQKALWIPRSKNDPEVLELYRRLEPHFGAAMGGQDKPYGGRVLAFAADRLHSYVAGDATMTYNPLKCEQFVRQFLFVMPDYFILFDRVKSVRPEYRKTWLLHVENEPELKGNTAIAESEEGGLIAMTALLPERGNLSKIGGPGKEFWGDGVNWTIYPDVTRKYKNEMHTGKWRIELSPAQPAHEDFFLNVLQVGKDRSLKQQLVKPVLIRKNDLVGTRIELNDGRVVEALFRTRGAIGGHLRITDRNGKVLTDAPLAESVQKQSGY